MTARTRLLVLTAVLALLVGPLAAMPTLQAASLTLHAPAAPVSLVSAPLAWLGGGLAIFGAIKVKDAATVAAKFKTRASAAAGDYKTGVQQAGADWEAGARAGEGNYEQGVTEAIGKKRYGRGIAAAGASKYVNNAVNLGATRYPQGIQNAEAAYTQGIQPVLQRIAGLTLPPRGPRRSPQNQARANAVAMELGKMKDGQ
jgi:hypothetical protein